MAYHFEYFERFSSRRKEKREKVEASIWESVNPGTVYSLTSHRCLRLDSNAIICTFSVTSAEKQVRVAAI